jgi:replication initiation and membrane attachment protein DnaB
MPLPCKYFLRLDLYRTDLVKKVKTAAVEQCKNLVKIECFLLFDKDTGEIPDTATVEFSRLFHASLSLLVDEKCNQSPDTAL